MNVIVCETIRLIYLKMHLRRDPGLTSSFDITEKKKAFICVAFLKAALSILPVLYLIPILCTMLAEKATHTGRLSGHYCERFTFDTAEGILNKLGRYFLTKYIEIN